MKTKTLHLIFAALTALCISFTSCSDSDTITTYPVSNRDTFPEGVSAADMISGTLKFSELNTGMELVTALPMPDGFALPLGTYNVEGSMTVKMNGKEQSLRTVAGPLSVTSQFNFNLTWFFFNPSSTLLFSEIYTAGSLNATGKGGLYDSYFLIYNNTDQVQYADRLAICESKLINAQAYEILSKENFIEANFTAQTVYVIPGNGTDHPIEPGKYIKVVDQAINWSEQVAGAMDHRDADFEWYDEVTTGSVRDTDNPEVPNLEKWYSYSKTIWLPSNQCNRSYVLVRIPEGVTPESYIKDYDNEYRYISAIGSEMSSTANKLIPYSWVLDGVNLCPTETWQRNSLPASVDMGFMAISDKTSDVNRFGRKFVRRQAGVSAAGNIILQDTDNSAADFQVLPSAQ